MTAPGGVALYVDGAGAERVGRPGGWAFAAVRDDTLLLEASGHAARTTSLLMEFEAATQALHAARAHGWTHVELISDCRIALDVVAGTFLPKPPHVRDAALRLRDAAAPLRVTSRWVRAHSGEPWNEAVDAMAAAARGPISVASRRTRD